MSVRFGTVTVDWLGHAAVRIEGQTGAVIYVDPGPERYGVLEDREPRDGDLVLVSHGHHYDPDVIRRVAHEDAIVVVHESVDATAVAGVETQPERLPFDVERVRADESFVLGPLDLFTTPAYNEPAGPHTDEDGSPYHPEGTGCGFGVTVDGVTAFWPGDTDFLPFHEDVAADLLLPPIGGAVTMDRHDAAEFAAAVRPDLTLPVHYDTYAEIEADEEAFVLELAKGGLPVVLESP